MPFSLNEILNEETFDFAQFKSWLHKPTPSTKNKKHNEAAEVLFKYGGFPEPFKAQSEQIHNLWSKSRVELMIRQDLRDLSHILNIGQVEVLASFLPERIGSPLSKQSLVEDLDVAHTTLTRWLTALNSVYYHYEIKPFSKSIARSLKKEGKLYLYDWSSIESIGPKFENFIACQLLKLIHYLRDKEKNEVDFLVTNKQKPLFTVEAKAQDLVLDTTFRKFQKQLMVPHFQIVQPAGVFRKFMNEAAPAYVISFGSFFENLP